MKTETKSAPDVPALAQSKHAMTSNTPLRYSQSGSVQASSTKSNLVQPTPPPPKSHATKSDQLFPRLPSAARRNLDCTISDIKKSGEKTPILTVINGNERQLTVLFSMPLNHHRKETVKFLAIFDHTHGRCFQTRRYCRDAPAAEKHARFFWQ
jgi:hypothetical protein